MTTFPYKGQDVRIGKEGSGQVATTGFSIPLSSLDFWKTRLETEGVPVEQDKVFGHWVLRFRDPAGLILELIGTDLDERSPWAGNGIPEQQAIRGLFSVTLSIADIDPTLDFLSRELGFSMVEQDGPLFLLRIREGIPVNS